MRYQNKTSKDCKVSNLSEAVINKIIKNSEELILILLKNFLDKEQIKQFKKGDATLISLGVCTGMLNEVNDRLQTDINTNLCILDTDTLDKFKSDIRRDF